MKKFEVDKTGIYKLENTNKIKIADYMKLKEIVTNMNTNEYKAIIEYKSFKEIKEIEVSREQYLNKNNLLNLMNNGLDVTHSNVNSLVEYFREYEKEIGQAKKVHTRLGFENDEIYRLYNSIGDKSVYVGDYELKPLGSREEYLNMLSEEVYGKCELEFALLGALSAVILGYIGEELGLDSLIINLVGNSSSGKSTASKLGISLFGYPDVKKQSIYSTYNGTNNALLKKITGLKGVPFALDEISMSDSNDFTKFIYALANGADKDRLNKNSKLMDRESWLTTIISNGEKSLVKSAKRNAGIHVRVIEAENFVWTRDARNAQDINKVIMNNYGHVGIEFADYVIKQGKENVKEIFESKVSEIRKEILTEIKGDSMVERRCNKYALLMVAGYYYEKLFGISLDTKGIKEMIIKIEKESIVNRNFSMSAIEYIKQYIEKNKRNFEGIGIKPIICYGKIIKKNNCVEVEMNKLAFDEMIKEGGFEDSKVVLKELKKAGYLNYEKDRLTRSRKDNDLGIIKDVYVIVFGMDFVEDLEEIII